MEKICFKCGLSKDLSNFYAHSQMKDGYLNKCKVCTKIDVKDNYSDNKKLDGYIEKERKRCREKYHRLNYKSIKIDSINKSIIMKKYRETYPEKYHAKNLCLNIKTAKGIEKHHWSYNECDAKDVIFLTIKDHAKAHRFIIYDQERMMYRRNDTLELLDTKESHFNFINDCILNKES